MVTNINFHLTISIHCQEIMLWELIKWSPKIKYFDLLSNYLKSFYKEMCRGQFEEFVCGYWGLSCYKAIILSFQIFARFRCVICPPSRCFCTMRPFRAKGHVFKTKCCKLTKYSSTRKKIKTFFQSVYVKARQTQEPWQAIISLIRFLAFCNV